MNSSFFKRLIIMVYVFTITGAQYQDYAQHLRTIALEEKGTKPQTLAHLSAREVQSKIGDLRNVGRNKDIIKRLLDREKSHYKDYYTFYSAIPYMMLFQDVAQQAYLHTYGAIGALQRNAFQFVRYNYTDPIFNQYHDVTDFLIKEISKTGTVNDNEPRLKTILLSTNLALFGNIGFTGESTWHFFANPQPWVQLKPIFLINCLKYFGYPNAEKFADEFLALNKYLVDGNNNLPTTIMQIFIPKNIANAVAYVSWRHGIPFDPDYIKTVLNRRSMSFGPGDDLPYETIKELTEKFLQKWKAGDAKAKETVNNLLQRVQKGDFRVNPFLDHYMQDPNSITSINYHQARILITNNILLNPKSGVEVFREHSPVEQDKLKQYKAELDAIFKRMDEARTASKK